MAGITMTFFCCWTPIVVYSLVEDLWPASLPSRDSHVMAGYAFCLFFALFSCLVNPMLYTLLNESFKKELRQCGCGKATNGATAANPLMAVTTSFDGNGIRRKSAILITKEKSSANCR